MGGGTIAQIVREIHIEGGEGHLPILPEENTLLIVVLYSGVNRLWTNLLLSVTVDFQLLHHQYGMN